MKENLNILFIFIIKNYNFFLCVGHLPIWIFFFIVIICQSLVNELYAYRGLTESQNHRIVGVGRDLCGSSSPTLLKVALQMYQTEESKGTT